MLGFVMKLDLFKFFCWNFGKKTAWELFYVTVSESVDVYMSPSA